MTSALGTHYYLHERIGSAVNVTDAAGAKQWTYEYEPFGNAHTTTQDDPAAPTNNMRFAGEQFDDTGLYHLRARQMDPTTGRFLSTDPIQRGIDEASHTPYSYADNDPTRLVDPTGLRPDVEIGSGIANDSGRTQGTPGSAQNCTDAQSTAGQCTGKVTEPDCGEHTCPAWCSDPGFEDNPICSPDYRLPSVKEEEPCDHDGIAGAVLDFATCEVQRCGFALDSDDALKECAVAVATSTGPGKAGGKICKVTKKCDDIADAARGKIPDEWGPGKPAKRGEGWRWKNPENPRGQNVRVDKGNPDHVHVKDGGTIGPGGRRVPDNDPDRHIPLDEWVEWRAWNKP